MTEPAQALRLEVRRFTLAKDIDAPQQNQDAAVVNEATRTAAVADGVSAGIFCGPWARLLVDAVAAAPPAIDDREAFLAWLADRRAEWRASIDVSRLAWFQKAKLQDGAFTTLLGVRIEPAAAGTPSDGPALVRAWAIGDSCLLHVRQGRLIGKFPLAKADDFGSAPLGIGSVDRNRDALIVFDRYEAPAADGDLLALATDAMAEYLLRCDESGEAIDWPALWKATDDEWKQRVVSLRESQRLRYDDTTLVLIWLEREQAAPAEAAPSQGVAELPGQAVEPPDATPADSAGSADASQSGSEVKK